MPAATPAHPPVHLKVFIGSPGDVNDERQLALKLLNQMPYDPLLNGQVNFDVVMWDHRQGGATFFAGISAQDSVSRSLGKPADCDIVVICLWAKLGTPIKQPDYLKCDGGYYTGTEWEYCNAIQAFKDSGNQQPAVLLYQRTDKPKFEMSLDDWDTIVKTKAQLEQVEGFLQSCLELDGSIPNQYQGPTGFEEALERDLKRIVRQRLDELAIQQSLAAREPETSEQAVAASKIPYSVPQPAAEPYWKGSPFPGLRPFTNKDAPIFFGRGRETDDLLDRLRDPAQGFIAVVGASGSGKSSLVWAGLIPRLMAGALEGSENWPWVRFTPGELSDNPFTALFNCWKTVLESQGLSVRDTAETLQQHPEDLTGLMGLAFPELAIHDKAGGLSSEVGRNKPVPAGVSGDITGQMPETVAERPYSGLHLPSPACGRGVGGEGVWLNPTALTADKGKPPPQCLIFIDQFEELFTVVAAHYRTAFVRFLLAASASGAQEAESKPRLRIVVSVRADFYAQCVEQGLAELLRTGSYPLAAPGRGALYQMVTRPAALGGLAFENGLDEALLDDTGDEPGALPLLAFALEQLYQAKTVEGLLTHAAYQAFGKVQGAIGQRADAVFARLPAEVQARFTEVFRELVEVDERGVPTRRRAKLSEVSHSPQSQQLIDALTKARLLVGDTEAEVGRNKPALAGVSGKPTGQMPETVAGRPYSGLHKDTNNLTSTIEVAHEALFRSWGKLADWVTQTADDHRLRRQISQLAAYWEAHGRKDEHRWPDERVVEAKEMLEHLGLTLAQFDEREQSFLGPLDADSMLQEIQLPIAHERRAMIGVRLDRLGDTRKGVGLRADGLPDLDWVEIPGGEVTIAIRARANAPDAEVVKTITRTVEPFDIARYPVTVAQFQAFQRECHDGKRWHLPKGAPFNLPESYPVSKPRARFGNHPMDMVCWYDAVSFCHWLSVRLGVQIRLPTEFEWQCAAMGSNPVVASHAEEQSLSWWRKRLKPQPDKLQGSPPPLTRYPWGEDDWNPAEEPWRANSFESELGRSTAVGLYPAGVSAAGVCDLAGTVWEWCQNTYDDPDEVTASTTGAARVVRGGSWFNYAWSCRSAFRISFQPDYQSNNFGFRCARVQS
jgi:formylglycine-generating enzyme required for sulfatase activity